MIEQETIRMMFLMMECGSLELSFNQIIDKGILLIGNSKEGKTTSFHHMMHSQLEADLNSQNTPCYKLKHSNNLNDALIGDRPTQSQTQIPNVCDAEVGGIKIKLVDEPGFQDSYGFNRSLTNAYFIKKIFQKVKSIKIVLVTKYTSILNTADIFIKMLNNFVKLFRSKQDVEKVIPSLALLVTAVPLPSSDVKHLQKILQELLGSKNLLKGACRTIVQSFTKNKTIFIFKEANKNTISDINNKLLQQINDQVKTWWTRNIKDGVVSAQRLQTSLADIFDAQQTSSTQFSTQFFQFSKYFLKQMNFNTKSKDQNNSSKSDYSYLMTAFLNYLKSTTKQSLVQFQSAVQYLLQNVKLKNPNQNQKQLIQKYKAKWDKLSKQTLNIQISANFQDISNSEVELLKMRTFKKILDRFSKIMQMHLNERQSLKQNFQHMKQTLKIALSLSKKLQLNCHKKLQELSFILYLKAYISLQIYYIVSDITTDKKDHKYVTQLSQIKNSFPTSFKNQFQIEIRLWETLVKYVTNFNQKASGKQASIYKNIYKFFEQIDDSIRFLSEEDKKQQKISEQFQKLLNDKKMHIKYHYIESILLKQGQKNILDLIDKQIKAIQGKLPQLQTVFNDSRYEQYLALGTQYLQLLGLYFVKIQQKDKALQIYQSLNDAYKVLQIYKSKEEGLHATSIQIILRPQKRQQMLTILQGYMRKAYQYGHKELALTKAQKAYSFAQTLGDIKKLEEIGMFIYKISESPYNDKSQPQDEDVYLKDLQKKRANYLQSVLNGVSKINMPFSLMNYVRKSTNSPNKDRSNSPKRLKNSLSQKQFKLMVRQK